MLSRQIRKFQDTFELFLSNQASGGILLILCTIIALIAANLPLTQPIYTLLHDLPLGIQIGQYTLIKPTYHWVNDGLMAIFFLLAGLEIKREIMAGELSQFNKALLPVSAAIGGMIVPALIFISLNSTGIAAKGWAIPMATDIAFAIGVLSLLGNRIPRSLIILLTAIAIVDDLGAVTVIALFYTKKIAADYLIYAAFSFVILLLINLAGIRKLSIYLIIGAILWLFLLKSGIHATVAGVLLAFTIPGKNKPLPKNFTKLSQNTLDEVKSNALRNQGQNNEHIKALIHYLEDLIHHAKTPLQRLEHALHKPVMFIIVPIFVLINAGISFNHLNIKHALTSPLTIGIILGLILGKVIGIFGTVFCLVKAKQIKLPQGVQLQHMFALSLLAGIGFTMSIFIADLALSNQPTLLNSAKLGILIASIIAGSLGYFLLRQISKK
ncbi:Sodium/proton antiporter NhaA [Piscirickettsia salmonis]|uniref:Na+/H+ antiporter NhaA n=1 Tax=Piscirickettsia salmonis TaxID=1238 RepID=UPI0012B8A57E|nr:Na+/H+ antiporter NhaA [Piscirickettsia salmonis]QGP50889.1 Sodium/proton antiporter NhaA [Piscirickettsia salmonis]QGP55582.1 Sodium/proton antiporter NhaA [Piscirickettsia salmonis]QGP58565.1 Sodium/proton antiporter NhaA [Piscirickettsia salmonis]QGP65153.1 Sodium/proton antiporter NhaA [Piscirickettsia salmonis]